MQRYRAVVIGGGQGGRLSMDALQASGRFELLAACDLREAVRDQLERDYPGLRAYADHEELFDEVACDVVCVSTWAPSHRAITEAALALPLRGVLVEKPLGDTADNGRAVLDAIRARGLPVAVPHGLLVADHGRAIAEAVHGGRVGRVRMIEIQGSRWDLINAGIHWLDFAVHLLEDDAPIWVMAQCDSQTRTYRDGMQVETVSVSYAQCASGARIVCHMGDAVQVDWPGAETLIRVLGSDGVIEFPGWESRYRLRNADCPEGDVVAVPRGAASYHQRHLDALAEQIDAGEADYRIAEGSQRALELIEGAYCSARHGCQVPLPLQGFQVPPPVDWRPGAPYAGSGGGRDGRRLDEAG